MAEGLVLKSSLGKRCTWFLVINVMRAQTNWEYVQHTDGKPSPIQTLNIQHLPLK